MFLVRVRQPLDRFPDRRPRCRQVRGHRRGIDCRRSDLHGVAPTVVFSAAIAHRDQQGHLAVRGSRPPQPLPQQCCESGQKRVAGAAQVTGTGVPFLHVDDGGDRGQNQRAVDTPNNHRWPRRAGRLDLPSIAIGELRCGDDGAAEFR
jgi:hypothetical protein